MPGEIIGYVGRDATDEENEYRIAVELPEYRRALARRLYLSEGGAQAWSALSRRERLDWETKVLKQLKVAAELSAFDAPPRSPRRFHA